MQIGKRSKTEAMLDEKIAKIKNKYKSNTFKPTSTSTKLFGFPQPSRMNSIENKEKLRIRKTKINL